MRGMRKLRENLPNRVYHLISRVAHRAFFLNAEERTRFVELLKRVAAFSGVELLAYCVMTNHVHILVFVPEPEELSDDEVLSRMRILYRDSRFAELRREWDERLRLGRTASFLRFRGSFTRRMWNASEFMKTLKQHFTMSYNGRRTHAGTMWEGRYPPYLSPLVAGGYIAPVDKDSPSSSRRAYKLTRKGKEAAQW